MYFNSDAYSQLYPRHVEKTTPLVESMVENFKPDEETISEETEVVDNVGEGTDGTASE